MVALSTLARIELAPPRYLSLPTAGIDLSAGGVKVAMAKETLHGRELDVIDEERFPPGVFQNNEIADRKVVHQVLTRMRKAHGITFASVSLPEARGYLFETSVPGSTPLEWRSQVERRLEEFVPLPPAEVVFDIIPLGPAGTNTQIVGIAYARQVIESALLPFESAGITVRALECETFALPRAVLPVGTTDTVLIIDIGKTTTKLSITTRGIPRFATTLDMGGHALTLAVQKHFGVTEEEAKRVKVERGLVVEAGNEEYLSAMLSSISVIREEITRRLDYWQTHAGTRDPVTRALLVGGNATLRGLPEYLSAALRIPVELGDVFTNFAPKSAWLPPVEYTESLGFGTAVGLALRDHLHG